MWIKDTHLSACVRRAYSEVLFIKIVMYLCTIADGLKGNNAYRVQAITTYHCS